MNILISDNYNFVLYVPPKNGSVTLAYWFYYLEKNKLSEFESLKERPNEDIHKIIRSFETRQIKSSYIEYFVLRNPWIRLASAYFSYIKRYNRLSEHNLNNISDLIQYLKTQEDRSQWNSHIRPQLFDNRFSNKRVNFLRTECLQTGINGLAKAHGIPQVKLPNWKKSIERKRKYAHLYSSEEVSIIKTLYEEDVSAGEYKCPDTMIIRNAALDSVGSGL